MNAELFEALELLEKTKGIPVPYMIEKLEAAMQSAYKKEYGSSSVRVAIDPAKKDMKVYRVRTVTEEVTDDRSEISLDDAHKIRKKKKEEVISAIVTKRDDTTGDVEVDTGTSTAWLAKTEQLPGDNLHVGDRIRVFVSEVKRDIDEAGPLVTLSRIHPNMLKRMFETDIPEIADGIVLIKGVAREAGSRSKIAVMSRDPEVDAVGACIGNRGMRINAIVEELHGEKIDVIAYSDTPETYIAAALSPATVLEVEFDGERSAKAIVSGDQLSLAIGKEGQNVRLAAKLTGCKIDIRGVKAAE